MEILCITTSDMLNVKEKCVSLKNCAKKLSGIELTLRHSMRYKISVIALSLCLYGCAGMSSEDNQRLHHEISEQVTVDMKLSTAEKNLTKIGFSCDEVSAPPEITCTRTKDNIFLYSCLQRVNLALNFDRKNVSVIKLSPIVCAGF